MAFGIDKTGFIGMSASVPVVAGGDTTEDIDALASNIDGSSPTSANESEAITTIASKTSAQVSSLNLIGLKMAADFVNSGNIAENADAIDTIVDNAIGLLIFLHQNYIDGDGSDIETMVDGFTSLSSLLDEYVGEIATSTGNIFDATIDSTLADINNFIVNNTNFNDFCSLTTYASSSALETAKPASSNSSKFALVEDANPSSEPQTYKSNGSSWSPVIPVSFGRVWAPSTVTDYGRAALLGVVSAAGANLFAGDIITVGVGTSNEEDFKVVEDDSGNLHYIPLNIPGIVSKYPTNKFGFRAQIPSDGDWTNATRGTGTYIESGGIAIATAVDTGNNEGRATAGTQAVANVVGVFEGVYGSFGADNDLELVVASSTSNRYGSIRNTTGKWNLSGSLDSGVTATVVNDIEAVIVGAANLVYFRVGRSGSWLSGAPTGTFALGFSGRIQARKNGGTNAVLNMTAGLIMEM